MASRPILMPVNNEPWVLGGSYAGVCHDRSALLRCSARDDGRRIIRSDSRRRSHEVRGSGCLCAACQSVVPAPLLIDGRAPEGSASDHSTSKAHLVAQWHRVALVVLTASWVPLRRQLPWRWRLTKRLSGYAYWKLLYRAAIWRANNYIYWWSF